MIFTRRRMGVFLLVMAGLAVVDWILVFVAFRGSPAIFQLLFYGEPYEHYPPPLPSGLIRAPCPGNGFASVCAPWALLLIIVFTFSVGLCLYVSSRRALGLVSAQGWVAFLNRRWLVINLAFVASALLTIGYVWGWLQYFGIVGQVPGFTQLYQVLAPFIPILFLWVTIAAGRHLRRSVPPD